MKDGKGWAATYQGIMLCGHIWTCPVCSAKLRAQRLEKIDRALENSGGTWVLVTFTVRHHAGLQVAQLLQGLAKAFRRLKQGGRAMQALWTARVSASIRATEITYGENGWHPHVHVLIRSDEWTPLEKTLLAESWERSVRQFLGAECVPNRERGVRWSEPFNAAHSDERVRARYLTKLGCEIVGEAKEAKNGNRSMWRVAEHAARGDAPSVALWRELVCAVRGRRMIELDDRAAAYARMPRDVVETPEPTQPEVRKVFLWQEDLDLLRRIEARNAGVLAVVLRIASGVDDPERAVRDFLSAAAQDWFLKRKASEGA